jgi:hypothetical protein
MYFEIWIIIYTIACIQTSYVMDFGSEDYCMEHAICSSSFTYKILQADENDCELLELLGVRY